MVLTPLVAGATGPLYQRLRRFLPAETVEAFNLPDEGLRDHVVILGGGRVGGFAADVLRRVNVPSVVVELDQQRIEQLRADGASVIYGDASQPTVLEKAAVAHARLVLLTIPADAPLRVSIQQVRRLSPNTRIVARAESTGQLDALYGLGVQDVVQPESEAGLEIVRQTLLHLQFPITDIHRFADSVRHELYAPLYEAHREYEVMAQLNDASRLLQLQWVSLPTDSSLTGQTLAESDVRNQTGVSIVGVIRRGTLFPNPDSGYRFSSGDMLALLGDSSQIELFQLMAQPFAPAKVG
jgi:CPA2 family monovalent cation:H+ antiporter-2